MRYSHPILLSGALLLVVALLGSGCDFQRVDEGADMPLSDIMADLSQADTPSKAEEAIEHLFQKAEIGVAYKAGLYDGYEFKNEELKTLAEAHAAYIHLIREGAGADDVTPTMSTVYDEVMKGDQRRAALDVAFHLDRTIEATLDRTLEILEVSAKAAVSNPETPGNSLVLSITSDASSTTPAVSNVFAGRELSPVQRMAFGIWLHKNGPKIRGSESTLVNNANDLCPVDYPILVAKWEYNGSDYSFEKPDGNEDLVTITSGSTDLSGSWSSVIGIDAVVKKGGSEDVDIITRDTDLPNNYIDDDGLFGEFDNSNLFNNGNAVSISHLEFCREDDGLPGCLEICAARLNVCLLNANGDANKEAACQAEYVDCDAACHDQGGSTG